METTPESTTPPQQNDGNSNAHFLTPEVEMDTRVSYLVRENGVELAIVSTEDEALYVIDSVALTEMKRIEKEFNGYKKVYRENMDDGKKIVLYTQSQGRLYNGSVTPVMTLDYVGVGHAIIRE